MRRVIVTLAALVVSAMQVATPAEAKRFPNCKKLNAHYAHGGPGHLAVLARGTRQR